MSSSNRITVRPGWMSTVGSSDVFVVRRSVIRWLRGIEVCDHYLMVRRPANPHLKIVGDNSRRRYVRWLGQRWQIGRVFELQSSCGFRRYRLRTEFANPI